MAQSTPAELVQGGNESGGMGRSLETEVRGDTAAGFANGNPETIGSPKVVKLIERTSRNFRPPTLRAGSRAGGGIVYRGTAGVDALEVVRQYLDEAREEFSLSERDVVDATVTSRHRSRHNGVTHLYMRQRYEGLDVYGADANFNIGPDGQLFSAHVGFVSNIGEQVEDLIPVVSAEEAVLRVARDLGQEAPESLSVVNEASGREREMLFSGGELSQSDIPARLMVLPIRPDESRLVWNTVLRLPDDAHWLDVNVDADTGEVLTVANWVAHAEYNVFPIPYESPDDGPRSLRINPQDAAASPFGWHDTNGITGADSTTTRGNNVNAQEDANADNTGGYRPNVGSGLSFNFPLNLSQPPQAYRDASLANLFYWNNILHDVHYQYGFNEAAGNFQLNNYGNGGAAGDAVEADSLDGSGVNNANFATPPDGMPPRMQMFLWQGAEGGITVNAPAAIAGNYTALPSAFGPRMAINLSANLVLVNDGSSNPTQACFPLINAVAISGRFALIDRGGCNFVDKVRRAQHAGAIGVIVANDQPGEELIRMTGVDPSITIPSFFISYEDAQVIRARLAGGVNVTLQAQFDRDSSLDNLVIIHEYGHGVSNRLTGGAANSSALYAPQSRGMGEGWSDWWGLALTAKAGDTATTRRAVGTYLLGQSDQGAGIRPAPYTTDFSANSLTFGDLEDPTLSIPHGIGTIWCTALWEMYWNLVDTHGFDPDFYGGNGGNNLALQLVMDGLKLQPANPTYLDARDAILLADRINNGGANQDAIWRAFAKRGMGFSAYDGGSSSSLDVVESFDLPDDLSIEPGSRFPFLTSGSPGGPFGPSQQVYELENTGGSTISWIASTGANWLTVAPGSGSLSPGQSIQVVASVNANGASLPLGVYRDRVVFRNVNSGIEQGRDVGLGVNHLSDALDTGNVPVFTGLPPWFRQTTTTHDGVDAAQSAHISHDGVTSMQTTLTGPDTLVFWWKVSSEEYFDILNLVVDGIVVRSISGEVDWTQVSLDIPPGDHVVKWEYSKDFSVTAGADAAWVDEIEIAGNQPPILTSTGTADGLVGESLSYQIEATESPSSYGSEPLPAGLAIDTGTGLISGMPLGAGDDTVELRATNGFGTGTKPVTFRVRDVASLPFFENFESGALNDYWLSSVTNTGRTVVTQSYGPHEGGWHLAMDSDGGQFSRNELTVALDLTGQENVLLTFWAREYTDESHGPPPSPFQDGFDFDGVAVSEDGVDWYEVKALRGAVRGEYRLFAVELDKEIASRGMSYGSAFRIRFNHFDDEAIADDGIAIDDIRVQSVEVESTLEVTTGPDGITRIFSGVGTPGALISLVSNRDGLIGEVEADGSGNWTIEATGLRAGTHNITISVFGIPVSHTLVRIEDNRPPGEISTELFSFESTWKYLDDGSDQYTGTPFYGESFDDSGWAEGTGRFGYGGDGEITTIDFGPNPSNKPITTYFRKTFEYHPGNTTFDRGVLSFFADDGIVVYLNGEELHRHRMGAQAIGYQTTAASEANDDNELYLQVFEFDPSLVREGENLIAVSVHQRGAANNDLGFDMRAVLRRDWYFAGVSFGIGANAVEDITTADVDGDGDPDVVYADDQHPNDVLAYRLNMGENFLGDEVLIDSNFFMGSKPIIVDLENNGTPDVVACSVDGNYIRTYRNDGSGNFTREQSFGGFYPFGISLEDVDEDGYVDLLYQYYRYNEFYTDSPYGWRRNNGTGVFGAFQEVGRGHRVASTGGVLARDMDGDGDKDFLICMNPIPNQETNSVVSWFENDGSENFSTKHDVITYSEFPAMFAEDLDGDGDVDIVLDDLNNTFRYENDGSGNFGRRKGIQIGRFMQGIQFRDLDRDSDLDLLCYFNPFNDHIEWRENDGKGNFSPAEIMRMGYDGTPGPGDLEAVDWNLDGYLDVIVRPHANDFGILETKFGAGPRINSFTVDDNTVQSGATVSLSWATEGASEVRLNGEVVPTSGSVQRILGEENSEFVLIATNVDGTTDASLTVFVPDPMFALGSTISEGVFLHLEDISIGDLNGDGLPDIAVADELTHKVAWIPNLGGGNFGAPVFFPDILVTPVDIEVGDFDQDGINDIVVLSGNSDVVAFYKNSGNAAFGGHSDFPVPGSAFTMWRLDFDSNGSLDLFIPDSLGNKIYLNNGNGTFGGGIQLVGNFPDDFALADVNRDGIRDYVSVTNTFTIYPGVGPFTFSVADRVNLVAGSLDGKAVHASDFTGNGELDLLLTYSTGGTLYRRDNFDQWKVHSRIARADVLDYGDSVAGDFDQDGDIDIALSVYETFEPGSLFWAENDGGGVFSEPQLIEMDLPKAYDLHLADMDNDGKLDLVRPGNTGTIQLFRNISGRPSQPMLSPESDSGGLDSDNVTSATSPDFSGTASPGAIVVLRSNIDGIIGTTTADASGFWSITGNKLSQGSHQVTVSINGGQSSSSLLVEIDTVAQSPFALALAAGSDTGSSLTDKLTRLTNPVITGTSEAGATVELVSSLDGAIGSGEANSDFFISTEGLSEGVHEITARATDRAGNVSDLSAPLVITVDTTPPGAVEKADLEEESDTGPDNQDDITSDTTPTLTGNSDPGVPLLVLVDGETVGVAEGGPNWNLTTSELEDGLREITVRQVDDAGNASADSEILYLTIDSLAPSQPGLPDLDATSDLGASNSDNITSVGNPLFSGSTEPGTIVTLFSDGVEVAAGEGGPMWQLTPASSLGGGPAVESVTRSITVQVSDVAGNLSGLSPALPVTIDQKGPVPTLSRGTSQPDPARRTPIFFRIEFNETVTGFTVADVQLSGSAGPSGMSLFGSGSSYTLQVNSVTGEGDVTIAVPGAASLTDAAGNVALAPIINDDTVEVAAGDQPGAAVAIPVGSGSGTFHGTVQDSSVDYYSFVLNRAKHVRVYTSGSTDTIGTLLTESLEPRNDSSEDDDAGVDENFEIDEALPAGTYLVAVTSRGAVPEGDYNLFIQIGADADSRPDNRIGISLTSAVGDDVYEQTSGQTLQLVSRKARSVRSVIGVENDASLPDSFFIRGTGGTGVFRVSYSDASGNITSEMLTGKHETEEMSAEEEAYALTAQIFPNKRKIQKKIRRGSRRIVKYRKKQHAIQVKTTSRLFPDLEDWVILRVTTR